MKRGIDYKYEYCQEYSKIQNPFLASLKGSGVVV
jgi:hypothetical protein